MSKDGAINIMNNSSLIDKMSVLYFFFIIYKKWVAWLIIKQTATWYWIEQKNYYENDKERLREKARDKYRNLSEEDKNKKKNMEKADIIICLRKRNKN